jgi:hypothetical protein
LIQLASKDIKTLNLKLARIVSTESIHQELSLGNSKDLDIIPEQSIFARLPLKGLKDQQMMVKVEKRGER